MLTAFGWMVVRTLRSGNTDQIPMDELHVLDQQVHEKDLQLWHDLRSWLASTSDPWLNWQLFEELNHSRGLLQFCTARNHRGSSIWDLMAWAVKNGPGPYALVYVHDDEDNVGNTNYGRGLTDFTNVFKVWRICNGELTELADPFLSPIVPTVTASFGV